MDKLADVIFSVIGVVFTTISPELRRLIEKNIEQWEQHAASTKSPMDDIAVRLVKSILRID